MIRARRLITAIVLGLALATTGVALEATALAKTHPSHRKSTKHHAKKRSKRAASHGTKGDKGDKGDPGAKGDKGDKGDPASSIVARARLGAATSSGDGGNDVDVPMTGNSWTAVADEADDFAGTATATAPAACDGESSSILDDPFAPVFGSEDFPGYLGVGVQLDGHNYVGEGFYDWSDGDAAKSITVPLSFRTRAVAGDGPTPHTLTVKAFDGCTGDNQSFTITDLRINVYGMH